MKAPDKPVVPAKMVILGSLVRDLRCGAGLTRRTFGEQVKLSAVIVKAFECGRLNLSTEELQRVQQHPAMRDLPALAAAAGLELPS